MSENNLNNIKEKKSGSESYVEIYDDKVIKRYKKSYFEFNKQYNRKGEIYYLEKYKSPFFISMISSNNDFIELPYCGEHIGISRKDQTLRQTINHLKLVKWLKELEKELIRLNLEHRDINLMNILYSEKDDKYILIDFGWMTEKDNSNINNIHFRLNNKCSPSDKKAIEKICIQSINCLISKIASGKRYQGSSTKSGWIYHPIPFDEFSAKCHKSAAIQECNEVIDLIITPEKPKLNILDIGCSVGYFSFELSKFGHTITGVEAEPAVHDVSEAIRVFKGIDNIRFVNETLDTNVLDNKLDQFYDVTLMLNVHMWIYKYLGPEKTLEFMRRLSEKTKYLLFQTAGVQSGGMYQIEEFKNNSDIEKYLYHCNFSKVTHIRDTKAHGGIRSLFFAEK